MNEVLLALQSPTLPPLVTGYTGINYLSVAKTDRLSSTMFTINGVNYLYGGHNASYTAMNDLYSFARDGNFTAVADVNVGTQVVAYPKACVLGTKAYIFGVNATGYFCVKIFDAVARTTETIVSTVRASAGTLYVQPGADYSAAQNAFFMKFSATNVVAKFDVATKTFTALALSGAVVPNTEFVGNEFLLCGKNGIYVFCGWAGSAANMAVHKIPYTGGEVTLHGRLEGNSRHSVNQGYGVKNGICYYPTWNGAVITFNALDPENMRQGDPIYSTGLTYRNASSLGLSDRGFFIGGGTTAAVGSSGWTTSGRVNTVYEALINFNANPSF